MLGLSGDREGGFASLRLAAEKGTYTRTEARLYLSQFLFAEGRQDTAVQLLDELRSEYPENTLFTVLYAFWEHRLHNLDEAMKAARAAVELNKRKKVHYGEELAYSTLGSVYYTLNDFQNAKKYYGLYMQMTHNDQRTPNYTFLRAGVACEIAGDRAAALKIYQRMQEPDEDHGWDVQNYRRGRELLRHPLTEAEVLLIKGENERTQKKYANALQFCNAALAKSEGNVDIQARVLYAIQQSQLDSGQFAGVVETANRILSLKPVNELWVIPHAIFLQGRAYAQMGRISEARQALEKIGDYDDYEFQDRLETRVKEELDKLGQSGPSSTN
jgi:tetratricopeptide (TPR) repeat protein